MSHFNDYLFMVQTGSAILECVAVLAVSLKDTEATIVFASPLLEEMFGYEVGELRGQKLDILLRPEDREIHGQHLAEFRKAPRSRTMNEGFWVSAVKKNGEIFKVQISINNLRVGREECVIATVADVTSVWKRHRPEMKEQQ